MEVLVEANFFAPGDVMSWQNDYSGTKLFI